MYVPCHNAVSPKYKLVSRLLIGHASRYIKRFGTQETIKPGLRIIWSNCKAGGHFRPCASPLGATTFWNGREIFCPHVWPCCFVQLCRAWRSIPWSSRYASFYWSSVSLCTYACNYGRNKLTPQTTYYVFIDFNPYTRPWHCHLHS